MKLNYFKLSEFDSPDVKGSGSNMSLEFLEMLDEARDIAEIPFRITSGFRTQEHHDDLTRRGYKTSKTSSHLKGLAADIAVTSSKNRYIVFNSLLLAGFTRIGIANNFIHVDLDEDKTQEVVWTY
tara:strand:- start:122 stop:496 length:375 start_codon:yes stop_codon:yes gene_type:complete